MAMIEGLEGRQLLAGELVRVKSIVADNRGEVQIQLSERAVGVSGSAVQIYTAGADGKLFTNDDIRQQIRFTYSENRKLIKLTANLAKDTAYRVKLDGKTRIKSEASGLLLDGDYSKNGSSGDGRAGGNYEAQFGRDRSTTPTAVFRTSAGDVTIRFRGDVVPTTVTNVISYMNKKSYDGTILHRNGRTQSAGLQLPILQGGGFTYNGTTVTHIATDAPVPLEAKLPNAAGTFAMARQSAPNTNTSEFFINVSDDFVLDKDPSDTDGTQSGYTVFANVTSGMNVITTIYNNPTVALDQQFATNAPTFGNNPVTIYRAAVIATVSSKTGAA